MKLKNFLLQQNLSIGRNTPSNSAIRSTQSQYNSNPTKAQNSTHGFTIVELLIVIVVIGILATIVIVAYNGIQDRATETVVKSDLSGAAKQLAIDKALTGTYPSTVNPDGSGDANEDNGLAASSGTEYQYDTTGDNFCLSAVNGDHAFHVTENGSPAEGVCEGHSGPVAGGDDGSGGDGITIGSQTWAATNLNVGTMVPVTTEQTNNSTVEKYCFDNDEDNCEADGGLYQWNEAMQYSTSEGAQGICPAGWHIPTDDDWQILEEALGMSEEEANDEAWRGFDDAIGTQLKPGGSSGLDLPLAGNRSTGAQFYHLGENAHLWSSSESGSKAWDRHLYTDYASVNRFKYNQSNGFSVRCLEN